MRERVVSLYSGTKTRRLQGLLRRSGDESRRLWRLRSSVRFGGRLLGGAMRSPVLARSHQLQRSMRQLANGRRQLRWLRQCMRSGIALRRGRLRLSRDDAARRCRQPDLVQGRLRRHSVESEQLRRLRQEMHRKRTVYEWQLRADVLRWLVSVRHSLRRRADRQCELRGLREPMR
jgi:hypothetical protein